MWKAMTTVSSMETDGTRDALAEQLREIERGRAAPWISYPPMAWWWPLGFGVWTATYTLSQGLLDVPLTFLSSLLHLAVALLAVWWMRRVRGTYPSGRSPRELNGSFALLFVGAAVVALAVWGAFAWWGPWAGAGVGLVLAWGLVAAYEQQYAAAARRVRERLG